MITRPLTIVSADPETVAACQAAAKLAGEAVGSVSCIGTRADLEQQAPDLEGLLILDPGLFPADSAHEWTMQFLRHTPVLVYLLTRLDLTDADGLARFVGAQGAFTAPPDPQQLAESLMSPFGVARRIKPEPLPPVDEAAFGASLGAILNSEDQAGTRQRMLSHIMDPETGLFTPSFWEHRLEEEFKRCNRFRFPLGLVAFQFEGEVDDGTLLDAAGVILVVTRDVDIVAHFEPNTFVALLPHTGPAGAGLFADRVMHGLRDRELQDLLGEGLEWSHAVAGAPDSEIPTAALFLRRVLQGLRGQPA